LGNKKDATKASFYSVKLQSKSLQASNASITNALHN